MAAKKYNHQALEAKWRKRWEEDKLYHIDLKKAKKPYYNLMMFPYPSAEGLHVGNAYAFTGSDVHGRFRRMQGYDVFEPIGLDGFGIHSENFAIKQKTHPAEMARKTEVNFYRQLKLLGNIYDWHHTLETYDPDYYKWTQWIFVEMFKTGLAVRKEAPVDFCPSCKTVLADEQVISGACERCGTSVIQKTLSQWFFTITKYSERLLSNLEKIDWTEKTKVAQQNWIGKKEGAVVKFKVGEEMYIEVFTTRLDTICGATFLVLAPEHPLVQEVTTDDCVEIVKKYVHQSQRKTELERTDLAKNKTGVFTGAYALNPVTHEQIPIWIADYVLLGYGTGAIMGVPCHDSRDYLFAQKYSLPLKVVVVPDSKFKTQKLGVLERAYEGEGVLANSGRYNGLPSKKAIQTILKDLRMDHLAEARTTYHLRDWLISRQRYWGPPIPMIYCQKCANGGRSWFTRTPPRESLSARHSSGFSWAAGWYPVPEEDLPVLLPYMKDYQPTGTGESPLAKVREFVEIACPECGTTARRETDVSDTFLDSAWYFLRYPSARRPSLPWDPKITKKWLPVTMYIGGHEHAVLHLLYSRFLTMALHDMNHLHFEEPFTTFRAHGLLTRGGAKMSKSKGNVVVPDDYIRSQGTDALRTYLMFSGPFSDGGDWTDRGLEGVYRFLSRVWRLGQIVTRDSRSRQDSHREQMRHGTISRVTRDLERLHYNTAIAALMEYTNFLLKADTEVIRMEFDTLLLLLAPFAPFLTEELWEVLGNSYSVHNQSWPVFDQRLIQAETATLVVQINGKLRDRLEVAVGCSGEELKKKALASEAVSKHLTGKQVLRVVVVPDKVVNIVAR